MRNQVITISRQFGSGGRTIGRMVAEKLGIPCYDHELIERIAEETGFSKEYIEENSESSAHRSRFASAFSDRDWQGMSTQDRLWQSQRLVILGLAEKGPCVIIGRCADYILRDRNDCLKVFIHADMEKRAERIVRLYGESENKPEKRLRDKDKRRKAYYQYYTDMEWGDAVNYDLSLNSGTLGIETCVSVIEELYQKERKEND